MNLFRKNESDNKSDIDMDQEFKAVLPPLSTFQNNIKILIQIYHKPINFPNFIDILDEN